MLRVQTEIDRLKQSLEIEKQERLSEVTDLERRNVAAKERLKTEMFNKIKETKKVRRCLCCWVCAIVQCTILLGRVCARGCVWVACACACHHFVYFTFL